MTIIGAVAISTPAGAQGYPGYPYSIMTPERSSAIHQRAGAHRRSSTSQTPAAAAATPDVSQPPHPSLLGREKFVAKLHRRGLYAARGSSGSVLPTPLPRAQLIPPEGGGTLAAAAAGARPDQDPRHRENHSQSAAWSGNVLGSRLALYVPVRSLWHLYMGACVQ